MNINGKFSRVSDSTYKDGVVLVGFLGDVYPYDLSKENIEYIKIFNNMQPSDKHEFFNEWPEGIAPAYPAAKKKFINGFMLITNKQ